MNEPSTLLPLTQWEQPESQTALLDLIGAACAERTPVYPVGGGVSLDFGMPAKQPGWGVSLAGLNRIVDYPARDLTATVEAGVTLGELNRTLAAEGQCLPFDVPHPDRATVGGVVATAFCGARRYGLGSVRDFVIGVAAIDGQANPFRGGGRVVKNVAGYDFCKLLTGSLGTLGVITELTFKLRPLPQRSSLLVASVANYAEAESLLAALVHSDATPTAIELLAGPAWSEGLLSQVEADDSRLWLAVGLEGSAAEVAWMQQRIEQEWKRPGPTPVLFEGDEAAALWSLLADFPEGDAALTLKASVTPSGAAAMMELLQQTMPGCSLQTHAGNGIIIARCPDFPAAGLSRTVISELAPKAKQFYGSVMILKNPSASEMTPQACWGGSTPASGLMNQVKQQFDPHHLLNPGRFVFHG